MNDMGVRVDNHIREYKETCRRACGGEYGQQIAQYKGLAPTNNGIIRLNDFVVVKKEAPDTNFYGTQAAKISNGINDPQWEIIIKSEKPFSYPRNIELGNGHIFIETFNTAGTFGSGFVCSLIRKPLDNLPENPWALNKLTYNLIGRSPAGTFWADPANHSITFGAMFIGVFGLPGGTVNASIYGMPNINTFALDPWYLPTIDDESPYYGISLSDSPITGGPSGVTHAWQEFTSIGTPFGAHVLSEDVWESDV